MITVHNPHEVDSDILVYNERGEMQEFHFSYMQWKVPSEHNVNNRAYAAELQIFHTQRATDRSVALVILFDQELHEIQGSRAKTCFVDSFDFAVNKAATDAGFEPGKLEIPLKEFIAYVPQDQMVYYEGSHTTPDCDEAVTWIVNMHPHVISQTQVDELTAMLSAEVQTAGGNWRDIQEVTEDRAIYTFDNVQNLANDGMQAAGASVLHLSAAALILV